MVEILKTCRKIDEFYVLISDTCLCLEHRSAVWSSHEVYVDEDQIQHFEDILKSHKAEDGWNVLVFTHAPILGSNLRVLRDVHIKNGCAWINHTDEKSR